MGYEPWLSLITQDAKAHEFLDLSSSYGYRLNYNIQPEREIYFVASVHESPSNSYVCNPLTARFGQECCFSNTTRCNFFIRFHTFLLQKMSCALKKNSFLTLLMVWNLHKKFFLSSNYAYCLFVFFQVKWKSMEGVSTKWITLCLLQLAGSVRSIGEGDNFNLVIFELKLLMNIFVLQV